MDIVAFLASRHKSIFDLLWLVAFGVSEWATISQPAKFVEFFRILSHSNRIFLPGSRPQAGLLVCVISAAIIMGVNPAALARD